MKRVFIKVITVSLIVYLFSDSSVFAQWKYDPTSLNVITTAVPSLIIGPDARAGGMGDAGVSSTPDANSMHWNPAKYAFDDKDMGFQFHIAHGYVHCQRYGACRIFLDLKKSAMARQLLHL